MGNAIKRSTLISGPLGLALCFLCAAPTLWALEGQETLSPAKIAEVQKTNQSYTECVAKAASRVRGGELPASELPVALERCQDKYPGAGLFMECKKNVLNAAKGSELDVEEIARCKRLLTVSSFDPSDPASFFVSGNRVYFAGIGLNRDLTARDLQLPNFTCEKLNSAMSDISGKAQHILFGNEPRMFAVGPDQSGFLAALGRLATPAGGRKFTDVAGFGRVFGDPKSPQSMVYFPSAACDFQGVTGDLFTGVSLYYLPDVKSQDVTPYFGISYYSKSQKRITTRNLGAEVMRRLGPGFKAFAKDERTIFIAASSFRELDRERDPRNICQAPRAHQFIAVIHTSKEDLERPEYLLLANISNLCDYGDRQASKLARH